MLLERYTDLYEEKYILEAQLEKNPAGDSVTQLRTRLRVIDTALKEQESGEDDDELAAHWEAEIAAGRTPDLDMVPEDLKKLKGTRR